MSDIQPQVDGGGWISGSATSKPVDCNVVRHTATRPTLDVPCTFSAGHPGLHSFEMVPEDAPLSAYIERAILDECSAWTVGLGPPVVYVHDAAVVAAVVAAVTMAAQANTTPPELTARQRALYWLVLAEAPSLDEQLMIVSTLARQIRATQVDALAVREILLDPFPV